MRIALDGTVLNGRQSGIGYYCEELLSGLAAADRETEFFVFSHAAVNRDRFTGSGNIRWPEDRRFPIRAVYLHAILPRVLDRIRPDLCHYTNFLAPIAATHPYVVTIHDMGLETLRRCHPLAKRLYTRNLIPRIARNARLIITNSQYSKWEIVRRLGIPEDRIRVTPLAASPEFRPIPVERSNVTPYFLFVGNLEPRKNLSRLLDAFAMLKQLDHQLWIVGNAWYRAGAILKKAQNLGCRDRIRFLGYVPRTDLSRLYSAATAFVYPSLLEGFGLPVVEAMACGAPVITSDSSSLKEVAGNAAVLIDPTDVHSIACAMGRLAAEPRERAELSKRGIVRASEFSWETTARLTLDAYRQALDSRPPAQPVRSSGRAIADAIHKTLAYAAGFDYPLKAHEVYERLFDVSVDRATFDRMLTSENLPRSGDYVSADRELIRRREAREAISDRMIEKEWPRLKGLARLPFVRMLAFSGSTAHRNMSEDEDLDLFVVVEKGKLWFTFVSAVLWTRLHGVRRKFCINYLISDSVLPLTDTDAFTAQQIASLKPIYGKSYYDRFLDMNPFVRRRFPNFDRRLHRELYPEIPHSRGKRVLELLLRCGLVQAGEVLSRLILGRHLRRKVRAAGPNQDCSVLIERQRLKLHLHSHKKRALQQAGF